MFVFGNLLGAVAQILDILLSLYMLAVVVWGAALEPRLSLLGGWLDIGLAARASGEYLSYQGGGGRLATGSGYGSDGCRAELAEKTTFGAEWHTSCPCLVQKGRIKRYTGTDERDLTLTQQGERMLAQNQLHASLDQRCKLVSKELRWLEVGSDYVSTTFAQIASQCGPFACQTNDQQASPTQVKFAFRSGM